MFNGEGELILATGNKYNGAFKDGVKEGFGVHTFQDGSIYEGDWKAGVACGHGVFKS